MNRGSQPRADHAPLPQAASMRPRFMNRGSAIQRAPSDESADGFNEAPIHESGKSDPVRFDGCTSRASMRPRFMNRGSCQRPPVPSDLVALQ